MKPLLIPFHILLSILTLLPLQILQAQSGQISDILLVNGGRIQGEILFKHPNAELLILRSERRGTVQSLPLEVLQAVRNPAGQISQVNPPRELTEEELLQFQRNGLWGDQAGPNQIGRYAEETWAPRPLIVWAHPGESGDAFDPRNWLDEKGEPMRESPWTITGNDPREGKWDGDILLPAADEAYRIIQSGNRDHLGAFSLRHLTVEKNASYEVQYTILGNLWMKDGGKLGHGTQTGGFGSGEGQRHTFARFCNWHHVREPHWAYAEYISHWVHFDQGRGSMEIIGHTGGPSDRVSLRSGTLVISENSSLICGDRAAFFTAPGSTLILLDGAKIANPSPLKGGSGGNIMGTYGIGGTLLFGTPEHPLQRDLIFSACLYPIDRLNKDSNPSDRASGASWVFGPESRLVTHSADPTRARVVFRPRDRATMPTLGIPMNLRGPYENRSGNQRGPANPGLWEHPDIPKSPIILFRGNTDFNGVVFDGFAEGTILVSPAARRRWKNVSFGENNQASPEKLFKDL
ncbi:MAG: hypothetical protein JJU29_02440 [Verrucomicrobia bacterium]|nr:hypothetical protein [Verrucomicrobiota bacterium]MCH8511195.1 hypothetical protein [Kiritimatiellia bacterium]